jgi:hypothetical protein
MRFSNHGSPKPIRLASSITSSNDRLVDEEKLVSIREIRVSLKMHEEALV